jgi:hypothetical protein
MKMHTPEAVTASLVEPEAVAASLVEPKNPVRYKLFAALTSAKGQEEGKKMLNQTRYTNQKWGALLRQIVFVSLFTVYILYGHNADAYWIARGITTQIIEMEFMEEDSPVFNKAFMDIATVQEFEQWLHGPMLETFFGRNTFDGHSTVRPDSDLPYGNGGFVLGYNKIIGSVRISQLRSTAYNCTLPLALADASKDFEWLCYSEPHNSLYNNEFVLASEETADFGTFLGNQSYTFNGLMGDGSLVTDSTMMPAHERAHGGLLAWYRTRQKRILYPPPAFSVYIDPMKGYQHAKDTVERLYGSAYADLQTKALFVDLTVYNADRQFLLYIRLVVEVGTLGGAIPSYDFFTFKPDIMQIPKDNYFDSTNWGSIMMFLITLFYLYFVYLEIFDLLGEETERLNLTVGKRDESKTKRQLDRFTQYCVYDSTKPPFPPRIARGDTVKVAATYVTKGMQLRKGDPICRLVHQRAGEAAMGVLPHSRVWPTELPTQGAHPGAAQALQGSPPPGCTWVRSQTVYAPCKGTVIICHKRDQDYCFEGSVVVMFLVTSGDMAVVTEAKPPCYPWRLLSNGSMRGFVRKLRTRYTKWFCLVDLTNYTVFFTMFVLTWCVSVEPHIKEVNGAHFPVFFAEANKSRIVTRLNAFSNFLNWMKLAICLEWIPDFSLLFRTFNIAQKPIASFFVIFSIVFMGFAVSHHMLFSFDQDFRNIQFSMLSLFRMLVGDLDSGNLFEWDPLMGPFMFVIFIALCVLIVFNILVSMLMDAYSEARALIREERAKGATINLEISFIEFVQSSRLLRHLGWSGTLRKLQLEESSANILQMWWRLTSAGKRGFQRPPLFHADGQIATRGSIAAAAAVEVELGATERVHDGDGHGR